MGKLTDLGASLIARCCRDLHRLDLSCNRSITSKGIDTILRGCPHLLELDVIGADFQAEDLQRLLPLSSTLLLFGFDSGSHSRSADDLKEGGIVACGGRTLLMHLNRGLLEPQGLREQHRQQQQQSKTLIEQAFERDNDSTTHNLSEAIA